MSICSGGGALEECHCMCHTTGAMHIMACCQTCRYCNRNISMFIEDHELRCQEGQLTMLRSSLLCDDNVVDVSWKDGDGALLVTGTRDIAVRVSVRAMPTSRSVVEIHTALHVIGISPGRVIFSINPEPCIMRKDEFPST